MKPIASFFESQWKIQKFIMEIHKQSSKKLDVINNVMFVVYFVSSLVLCCSKSKVSIGISLITGAIYLSIAIFNNSIQMFTSIKGFIKYSVFPLLFSFLILYNLFDVFVSNYISINEPIKSYLPYIFVCLALCFAWCIHSSFCNIEISTIINGILTAGIGVLIEFKSVIINITPYEKLQDFFSIDETLIEMEGHNIRSMLDVTISLILFPLLLTLSIATVVCIIKKYWIKKYNCGMDINNELNIYEDVKVHENN